MTTTIDVEHGVTITAGTDDPALWVATCRCGWQSDEVAQANRAAIAYELHSNRIEPIDCTAWCIDRDGHPHERFREDQRCQTEIFTVPLALDNSFVSNGFECAPKVAWVYASHRADEAEPVVTVCLEDDRGISLTPAEAQQMAATIGSVLKLIDPGHAPS